MIDLACHLGCIHRQLETWLLVQFLQSQACRQIVLQWRRGHKQRPTKTHDTTRYPGQCCLHVGRVMQCDPRSPSSMLIGACQMLLHSSKWFKCMHLQRCHASNQAILHILQKHTFGQTQRVVERPGWAFKIAGMMITAPTIVAIGSAMDQHTHYNFCKGALQHTIHHVLTCKLTMF